MGQLVAPFFGIIMTTNNERLSPEEEDEYQKQTEALEKQYGHLVPQNRSPITGPVATSQSTPTGTDEELEKFKLDAKLEESLSRSLTPKEASLLKRDEPNQLFRRSKKKKNMQVRGTIMKRTDSKGIEVISPLLASKKMQSKKI